MKNREKKRITESQLRFFSVLKMDRIRKIVILYGYTKKKEETQKHISSPEIFEEKEQKKKHQQ